jgi:sulfate permease, SulP family
MKRSMNLSEARYAPALQRILPFIQWMRHYRPEHLPGDLMAGVIVAVMLIPQGMAYAMLAGLPPQVGLYASIVPLIIYGLLGSSRTLSVGPTAIASLLIAAGVSPLAEPGSFNYLFYALTLAFLTGLFQIGMGVIRLGSLVTFISHPVLAGFSSAAAIVIGFSQIKHVLGIQMPQIESLGGQIAYLAGHLREANPAALAIAVSAILILFFFKYLARPWLLHLSVPASWANFLARSGPFFVVLLGSLLAAGLNLPETAGLRVVGALPASLPQLTTPGFSLQVWERLAPTALTLALVTYLEGITIAKALASKRREKVNPNQELVATGFANLGAAFTGGHPVAGGFSRSVVNYTAGARTGLASIITGLLVAFSLLFLTPLFFYLPQATLAAIVVVAVIDLIDVESLRRTWNYNRADSASLAATFFAVLILGVEGGILVGVGLALALYLWRSSRPHIAVVGRMGDSEHFRNVQRHTVSTLPHVLALRVDESLYFANAQYLESYILESIADQPEIRHLLLIGSAINFIDASALETLEHLVIELRDAGVQFHLAEIKGPVMDRLVKCGFLQRLQIEPVYLSTHQAIQALEADAQA